MKVLKLTTDNHAEAISEALSVLLGGGIVAYPTETFYALGVKYDMESALKRLYEIKLRPHEKTMPLIIGSPEKLHMLTDTVTDKARELIEKYWPGPLTLVFHAAKGLSEHIVSDNKMAVRVPGESFGLDLARKSGLPLTATSANISGRPPADNASMVMDYFHDVIDLIIDAGLTKGGKPSTIVDVTENAIRILREGAIEIRS